MTKPLVIYHDRCTDGMFAAWCFWNHFGPDGVELHPGSYGKPPPDIFGRRVYLVDFSYKRSVVEDMLKFAELIIVLDHHKTALEDLAGIEHFRFNMMHSSNDMSGCMLAWTYLNHEIPAPKLLQHVQDRDLWRFEMPHSREFHAAVNSYPLTVEELDKHMARNEQGLLKLRNEGATIMRNNQMLIEQELSRTRRTANIGGHDVPLFNAPYAFGSEVCEYEYMRHNHPFVAYYVDNESGRFFGLRSKKGEGINVGEVAEIYGGGGHFHSAGFRVKRDHSLAQI